MIYAAFRAWKTLRRYFISLPSKTAFYCVTKSREPTTNESDVFSVLACTLFVSVDDKLVSILPYHRKAKGFRCQQNCQQAINFRVISSFPVSKSAFLFVGQVKWQFQLFCLRQFRKSIFVRFVATLFCSFPDPASLSTISFL